MWYKTPTAAIMSRMITRITKTILMGGQEITVLVGQISESF
jgi:hypothetical protein